jgi:hypothetical protein
MSEEITRKNLPFDSENDRKHNSEVGDTSTQSS